MNMESEIGFDIKAETSKALHSLTGKVSPCIICLRLYNSSLSIHLNFVTLRELCIQFNTICIIISWFVYSCFVVAVITFEMEEAESD